MSSSHPSDDEGGRADFIQRLKKEMLEQELGPTGRFPGGKLDPSDKGETVYAVGTEKGRVCIMFKTPTAWIGMEPEDAIALAQALIKHARSVSRTPLKIEFPY